MAIPTPHIQTKELGIIADTVLMPGDPLRAKFIAENFLDNSLQFNSVRGMLGYTGTYKGNKVSVMGSGMGMASIGIYSYELYAFYGVTNIIRLGSCGSYDLNYDLQEIILVKYAWSESTYAKSQSGITSSILEPSAKLTQQIRDTAKQAQTMIKEARIHSSDVFYRKDYDVYKSIRDQHKCVAVEMEAFSLFANATILGKNAACLLTVSDSLVTHESMTSNERQNSFTKMIKLALETIYLM